jgi:hypothetical protein
MRTTVSDAISKAIDTIEKIRELKMIFAVLILLVCAALMALWRGSVMAMALFLLTTMGLGAVFLIEIDTPLHLAF